MLALPETTDKLLQSVFKGEVAGVMRLESRVWLNKFGGKLALSGSGDNLLPSLCDDEMPDVVGQ